MSPYPGPWVQCQTGNMGCSCRTGHAMTTSFAVTKCSVAPSTSDIINLLQAPCNGDDTPAQIVARLQATTTTTGCSHLWKHWPAVNPHIKTYNAEGLPQSAALVTAHHTSTPDTATNNKEQSRQDSTAQALDA